MGAVVWASGFGVTFSVSSEGVVSIAEGYLKRGFEGKKGHCMILWAAFQNRRVDKLSEEL